MKNLRFFGMFFVVLVLFVAPTYLSYGQDEPIVEWVARYDGPGNFGDEARYIAVDSAGNVYVTGMSKNSDIWSDYDYTTVKYDSEGNEKWVRRYDGPVIDMSYDYVKGIAVDSLGNVYVTGFSFGGYTRDGGTGTDIATIKYDTNGNEIWVRRYNEVDSQSSYDYGFDIALDSAGNVYVTGSSSYQREGENYITIKYDSAGNELWTARHDYPSWGDRASAMAIYEEGVNVYVYVTGKSEYDIATIKYDNAGNELWRKIYDNPLGYYDDATAIAVDSAGNVYVTGRTNDQGTWIPPYSGNNYITIKYRADGNEEWVRIYNGPEDNFDMPRDIAVDSYGNVFVTGQTEMDPIREGSYDWATVKYDTSGNEEWFRLYDKEDDHDVANGIAVDSEGNVYVTGHGYRWPGGSAYHTIKYDTDGNELWATSYTSETYSSAADIALDAAGNVYITGRSMISGTSYDYVTIKYSQKRTPEEQIETIKIDVDRLYSEDDISTGKYRGMKRKLNEALRALERGNVRVACNKLHDFIDQVNAAIYSDPLTQEEGQVLIDAANELINELCG